MRRFPKIFPDIDVVIPFFERPSLVKEAAHSVLNQDYPGRVWLFLIEDGSSHAQTLFNNLKHFSSHNRSIFVASHHKNKGPSYVRNFGAAIGVSPFIAFLDSDDLWDPQKLSTQIHFFTNHPDYQWAHSNELWLREGQIVQQKKKHRKRAGQFLSEAADRCLISPSAVIFRRNFWEQSGGFAESFRVAEDFELWLRCLSHEPIGYIDAPVTIKRAGSWPQLSRTNEIDRKRVLALHRFIRMSRNGKHNKPIPWEDILNSAEKKLGYLIRGAEKYSHLTKRQRYQSWLAAFTRLRTRLI